MVNTQPKGKNDINSRLAILQSGYRDFVPVVRVPLGPDSKWLLEVVCLNSQPQAVSPEASIHEKAENFLKSFLWQYQSSKNKQRQDWIRSLRTQHPTI